MTDRPSSMSALELEAEARTPTCPASSRRDPTCTCDGGNHHEDLREAARVVDGLRKEVASLAADYDRATLAGLRVMEELDRWAHAPRCSARHVEHLRTGAHWVCTCVVVDREEAERWKEAYMGLRVMIEATVKGRGV